MKRFAGVLVAALLVCLFAVGCAGEAGSADNAITVSATATAEVDPDIASIAFTVNATGDNEDAAREAEKQATSAVSARLRTLGITDDQMKIGGTELSERLGGTGVSYVPSGYVDVEGNWVETVEEVYYDATGEVVGYDAKARFEVTGFAANRLGQVIRESVEAGATDFGGLVYEVGNREEAYHQALSAAVDAAHVKAESLAKASGVYVGRVVNMVETSGVPESAVIQADASFIDPANPATFEAIPDKVPVEASVTVSYAIS